MMAAIELINLHKQYGETRAVDGLSLEVDFGEIVGLIGPDGAGKTSTLRMVVTLLRPNAGDILFMGKDALREVAWVRAHVGYMPQ
ncbi:MAG TPA: ATP-binding cassette domain-containing protein, partial [Caldithrix abyssi]|nr:ATP-binding cassette domain-containing protein [Caldithrix abyssi]